VTPGAPRLRQQPFSVPFEIWNSGYVPLRDVTVECEVRRAALPWGSVDGFTIAGYPEQRSPRLRHNEAMTIECPLTNASPRVAELEVRLEYGYPLVPFWRARKVARFVGALGDEWHWRRQPSGD
jgi:hypothetical protein